MRPPGRHARRADSRGSPSLSWLEVLFQDVRFGPRVLRNNPGYISARRAPESDPLVALKYE
jgi:hypothetical protein